MKITVCIEENLRHYRAQQAFHGELSAPVSDINGRSKDK
jgi:hypothetical protein